MKKLLNKSGAQLAVDKQKKRLVLTVSDASSDLFKQAVEQAAQAVKEYRLTNCLVDLENRAGATQDTKHFALVQFEDALEQGLEKLAIILPQEEQSKHITSEFIAEMGRDTVRAFTNSDAAKDWLDGKEQQQRRAA